MTRSMVAGLGLAVAGLGLAGCGTEATEGAWSKEAAQYAIYATRIPLYPGTKIVDAMGSERIGVDAASSSYGMTWWCRVEATRAELDMWYEARLPTATRVTDDNGYLVFTVLPEGAAPRERMGVLIEGDGKYRVFEITRQQKPGT